MLQGYYQGHKVIGTLETLQGTAHVSGWTKNEEGDMVPVEYGDTEIHWDSAETVSDENANRTLVLDNGDSVNERDVEWKEKEEEAS